MKNRPSQTILPLSVEKHLPEPPRGWHWELLEKLARLESGHTPSRNHPEWWGGDIPWLALPDIRELDCKVAWDTAEHTNEAGLANSSARLLPKDTVCLSRTASVGFITILGRPMATSQDFVNWVCGPELDPYFLMQLLRVSRNYIRGLASGAVHKTVYVPTVKAFRICAPDVTRQRRIAAILDEQMAAVEKARKALDSQLEEIDALSNAILRRAFSGGL